MCSKNLNYVQSLFIASLAVIVLLALSCTNSTQLHSPLVEPNRVPLTYQVYPQLDTENSRWFYFASASRPFGMVNLSPDTQIGGAWGSGYRYNTDTIKGFSHIHGWQISGLSVMPVDLTHSNSKAVFKDYYSVFSHSEEIIHPGYHKVLLGRSQITAELTSTTRVGFHRYTFLEHGKPALLFNLNTLLGPSENQHGTLSQRDSVTLEGTLEMAPTHRRPKPLKLFFRVQLNAAIDSIIRDAETANYLVYTDPSKNEILLKAALSYTSIENARFNCSKELPHWDFNRVVNESMLDWEGLLGRIRIAGGTQMQQRRFYTDLWHALQGRRTISDANGAYPDNTGEAFRIGQIPLDTLGNPRFNHYNSDSFWGAQWTLNTLWGLVYPDIMKEFSESLMLYYRDGGLIPRGPSGGNYTYVMTGASTTPFLVSAIQKGIVKSGLEEIYLALKQNHELGGIMAKAGYEHGSTLGGGLDYYLTKGYVPYPIPAGKFGSHQDGASLTLEYAYQDWTLAQLAKRLSYNKDYSYFTKRSGNYVHVYDKETGWMRPKNELGVWQKDFDPYGYENGFNESNAAQATWFVPHNLKGLAQLMGGEQTAVNRLNYQFQQAAALGFTSGTSHEVEMHPEYSQIPINYGNQPSIQTAFIFNHLNRPDLTQFWSRRIVASTFGGLGPNTGYNGDEDQGLMGSLAVLYKLGLFQMTGGTEENPVYDLGSPFFDTVEIALHPAYYPGKMLRITSTRKHPGDWKVSKVMLNDNTLPAMQLFHDQIIRGGVLEFVFDQQEVPMVNEASRKSNLKVGDRKE